MVVEHDAPFIPLAEPLLDEACAARVADQVRSTFVGPGEACAEFSAMLGAYVGMPYPLLTVSGTAALSIAALAAGLKPGDEIVVPSYGVISTINAFASVGLKPALAAIDHISACVTTETVKRALTPATRAVCFVNFSGYTGPHLEEVAALCKARNLLLIEDAACALGQRYRDKSSGAFGDVSITSFSVPKVITTGQGGAAFFRTQDQLDHAIAMIDQGDTDWRKTNLNRHIGNNVRFNDVSAALGLAQMATLDARLARRRENFARLRDALDGFLHTVPGGEAPLHNIVFSEDGDALVAHLRAQKIAGVRQYRALWEHPPYANMRIDDPAARYWTDKAVYLPFGVALTAEHCDRIISAVRSSGVRLLPLGGNG